MEPILERRRYGPPQVRLLDYRRIRERRIANGLGVQAVADALAASSTETVWRLEHDADQGQHSLSFVFILANLLGCTVGDLLLEPQRPQVSDGTDAEQVGTLLAAADRWCPIDHLATSLGWDLERTHQALGELEQRLQLVGQRLARTVDRDVRVVPALADGEEFEQLSGRNIAFDGIRLDEATTIHQLAGGKVADRHKLSILALRHLVAAGVLQYTDGTERRRGATDDVELTEAARYNLCLE